MLSSGRGHSHCSRFNRTNISPGFNTNKNCNNKFGNSFNSFNSLNSVFNSFFNNNFNNNEKHSGPGTPEHNGSTSTTIGVDFRRTTGNYGGAIGIAGVSAYSRYNNDNTGGNAASGAYPIYRNDNRIASTRHAPFNIFRARAIYSGYRNDNRVVRGPYRGYGNGNEVHRAIRRAISVPTNVSSNRIVGVHNGNSDNMGNKPSNSLHVGIGIHPRPVFDEGNCSMFYRVPVAFIRTTLNTSVAIPALSNGIGFAVRRNARPNSRFGLGNGNVRHLGCSNGNSRCIGVAIRVPGGLSHSRGRGLGSFRGLSDSGGCGARGDFVSGIGSFFS